MAVVELDDELEDEKTTCDREAAAGDFSSADDESMTKHVLTSPRWSTVSAPSAVVEA